jgi:alkylation response protein AidB-like acyl-CoA dehydrogenase
VALEVARRAASVAPAPARGETAARWELLAGLGAVDLSVARLVEAHLDALAICCEAGEPGLVNGDLQPGAVDRIARCTPVWGVFAAQSPGTSLDAVQTPGGWRLSGAKPWCSAAAALDRALVTADTVDGSQLFAVDLKVRGVAVPEGEWHARGLVEVVSGPIVMHDVPGVPVGRPKWYVERDGMSWGGMGVAACWYGGAVAVARKLLSAAGERAPDDVALVHLGALDTVLDLARCRLAWAAAEVDRGAADGVAGRLAAYRVRAAVARCVDEVLTRVGHGLGPGPLAMDEDHARRVADLQLYVRQHHAERDERALGRLLWEFGPPW